MRRLAAAAALLLPAVAFADALGTIAFLEGPVAAQTGEIFFTELVPGDAVKVNRFSQYRGTEEEKAATVKWDDKTGERRQLKAGEAIPAVGEVIETGPLGYVRLYFKDDSIIDLGPGTVFAVQQFQMGEKERHITLRLLKGRIRVLVVRKLEGRSTYQVTTPGALISVRGTDFAVHTDLGGGEARTWVLGIRGQVTVDLARSHKKGEVYQQPVVVNTYSLLSSKSAEGYSLEFDLQDRMAMADYSDAMDRHAPLLDPQASLISAHLGPDRLPGTGISRSDRPKPKPDLLPAEAGLAAELEKEHTGTDLGGYEPSGNFTFPAYIERDLQLVNHRLGPYVSEFCGDRADRLPYEQLRLFSPAMVPVRTAR